jgi:hypothetical protein
MLFGLQGYAITLQYALFYASFRRNIIFCDRSAQNTLYLGVPERNATIWPPVKSKFARSGLPQNASSPPKRIRKPHIRQNLLICQSRQKRQQIAFFGFRKVEPFGFARGFLF